MSYQVLARKWRPSNFNELVGQEHVVKAISNGLASNRLHHAYLFTGTRGVGKTTIARILSKSLNCEVQVGANPCGKCPTCQDIEQGRYVDLLEIDAASRTKVEDTRELLDNVQYKPTRGRYKVYLIDEVHMLSKHSFNALLKTLEEPPEHVKFLLATTDPQKLPITILSRCLQFNLKALSREQIKQQISHILNAESITYDDESLNHLAHAAQGSMRDALSLTDQAVASGNGQVSADIVIAMLGLMDRGQLSKLLASVLAQDAAKTFEWVESLASQSPDYNQLMSELLSLLHQVALTQFVPEACKLETSTPKVLYQIASTISPEHVQLCYQIALQGRRDLPYAADGRSGLEMTLLRMLAFKPVTQKKSAEQLNQLTIGSSVAETALDKLSEIETVHEADREQAFTIQQTDASDDFTSEEHTLLAEQQDQIIEQAESLTRDKDVATKLPDTESEEPLPNKVDQVSNQALEEKGDTGSEKLNEAVEETTLSTTASLIAMKQQLKALNKRELDNTHDEAESRSQDFDSLSFVAPQEVNDESQMDESLLPDNTDTSLEVVAADNRDKVDEDIPPFDMEYTELTDNTVGVTEYEGVGMPPSISETQMEVQDLPHEAYPDSIEAVQLESELTDSTIDFTAEDDVEVTIAIMAFNEKGEKIIGARQIDQWSDVIEKMEVRGLTKQLALHSNYSRKDNQVTLLIAESKSHLNTDVAREQIRTALERLAGGAIEIAITFGIPTNTPFAIQQRINEVRQQYAYQLVDEDENVAAFKRQFDAAVEPNSTFAR